MKKNPNNHDTFDREIFDGLEQLKKLRNQRPGFAKLVLPLIRRTFANTIAKEIVSVQPMYLPKDLIYVFSSKKTNSNNS